VEAPEKEYGAHELEQAEEVLGLVLPAHRKPAPAFEPGEEALDLPTSLVAAQFASILLAVALPASDALGGDELDASLIGETSAQGATVPSLVTNQSRREFSYESSVESSLGEHTVESVSSINMDSEWKTMAVCNRHDLCRVSGTTLPDAGPPFFAGT
jgi:hypothetical protein